MTDLISPEARPQALSELLQSGYLAPQVLERWLTELSHRRYHAPFISGIVAQEKIKLDKLLQKVDGELTPGKTKLILENFVNALQLTGNSARMSAEAIGNCRVLDFGSGVWSSLSASLVLYANGFQQVDAFEPFPVHPGMVTESVFLTLRWLLENPADFALFGTPAADIKRRICALDFSGIEAKLKDLNAHRLRAVSLGGVNLLNTLDNIPNEHYGFIISNSVLEHIHDVSGTLVKQKEILTSDGMCVHTIDFSDHRVMDGDKEVFDNFQMYYDGIFEEINGLRASDFEKMFVKLGFSGKRLNRVIAPPGYVRLPVIDRYAGYTLDDLSMMVNSYVLRKP